MPAVFTLKESANLWADSYETALLRSASANNAGGNTWSSLSATDYAMLFVECSGNSAIWDLMVGATAGRYVTALTVTATVGTTAQYQISAFYPYVSMKTRLVYSAAGGSAAVNAWYRPGISHSRT